MSIDLSKLSDLELLFLTIVGESRGEPIEGQVAVGSIILNRCKKYNDTIDKVVLKPNQFSCWNSGDSNRVLLEELASKLLLGETIDPSYNQCLCIARGLLNHEIYDNTHNSLHYLTSSLFSSSKRPTWATRVTFAIIKGNQTFFNIPGE